VIVENGLVRTMAPQVPTQRALAIAGERIAGGVGVHETALASPEVVDLGGRVVVPGLNDARVFAGEDFDAVRAALKTAVARGVTAIHAVDGLRFWAELDAVGALTIRVWQLLTPEQWGASTKLGLHPGFGSSFLQLGIPEETQDLSHVYGSGRLLADLDPLADLGAAAARGVSLDDALETMTVRPAALAGDERRRGKLLPGYAADLVVLDRDPFDVEPGELPELRVVATMLGGRWVHNAPPWD